MDLVSEMMQDRKELHFTTTYDLAIVNTYFGKREEHYVTYKSGRNKSQIDNFMVRRDNAKQCKDCKVNPGESVTTQHRLMVMKSWCIKKRAIRREIVNKEARIR